MILQLPKEDQKNGNQMLIRYVQGLKFDPFWKFLNSVLINSVHNDEAADTINIIENLIQNLTQNFSKIFDFEIYSKLGDGKLGRLRVKTFF